jgi:hypothetical protein
LLIVENNIWSQGYIQALPSSNINLEIYKDKIWGTVSALSLQTSLYTSEALYKPTIKRLSPWQVKSSCNLDRVMQYSRGHLSTLKIDYRYTKNITLNAVVPGTTWCSALNCYNNKITNQNMRFFAFQKTQKGKLTNIHTSLTFRYFYTLFWYFE